MLSDLVASPPPTTSGRDTAHHHHHQQKHRRVLSAGSSKDYSLDKTPLADLSSYLVSATESKAGDQNNKRCVHIYMKKLPFHILISTPICSFAHSFIHLFIHSLIFLMILQTLQ
jgi:hypothetical protein